MSASRIFSTYFRASCTSNHMWGLPFSIACSPSVSTTTGASFFLSRSSGSAHLSRSRPFSKNSEAFATFLLSSGLGSDSSTWEPAGTIDSTVTRSPPTLAAMSAKSVVVARTSGFPPTAVPVELHPMSAVARSVAAPSARSMSPPIAEVLRMTLRTVVRIILDNAAARRYALPMPTRRAQHLAKRITSRGRRLTDQRLVVAEALAIGHEAVSAQELHERLGPRNPRLALATVYRALEAQVESGMARRLERRGHISAYIACEPAHHHHLVCTRCH